MEWGVPWEYGQGTEGPLKILAEMNTYYKTTCLFNFILSIWPWPQHVGSQFPNQGLNPRPSQPLDHQGSTSYNAEFLK